MLTFPGATDDSCPVRSARTTNAAKQAAGVDVSYVKYRGEGHTFYAKWDDSMRVTTRFLQREAGW